jgi:hypothetical protein
MIFPVTGTVLACQNKKRAHPNISMTRHTPAEKFLTFAVFGEWEISVYFGNGDSIRLASRRFADDR